MGEYPFLRRVATVRQAAREGQHMPKVNLAAVPIRTGSGYPAPFDAPRANRLVNAWVMQAGSTTSASTS
jgi:hypothetical protein